MEQMARNWDMTSESKPLSSKWSGIHRIDKVAAWQLYVELLTEYDQALAVRGTKTALVAFTLFPHDSFDRGTTGAGAWGYESLWLFSIRRYDHSLQNGTGGLSGDFDDPAVCEQFRKELDGLQITLRKYGNAFGYGRR